MSEAFYSHPRLYDLMWPRGPQINFYLAEAQRQGGRVLELACGTGRILLPMALKGQPCVGLDLSPDMLSEAHRKSKELRVEVEWVHGDMRSFHLGQTFDFVFVASNSLLHLHETGDLVSCFRSVGRHLTPRGRFVFDVFNPSVRLLADADGVRRAHESFDDPERGEVRVDVARTYDAMAQVTRETWYFSTHSERDFVVAPLEMRSIFPQELPVLLQRGGLHLLEKFGDFAGQPMGTEAPHQVCFCASTTAVP